MNICFIQKRIDKKIIFWEASLCPTENVGRAARYTCGDTVMPSDMRVIVEWLASRKKNFEGVVIPVCTDKADLTVNLLCNLEKVYRTNPSCAKFAWKVKDNICFQCPRDIAEKVVEIWKTPIPW